MAQHMRRYTTQPATRATAKRAASRRPAKAAAPSGAVVTRPATPASGLRATASRGQAPAAASTTAAAAAPQAELVFKRYEVKYLVDAAQRARLERAMAEHMVPDAHGASTVCNVYYDTPTLLLARRSADHPYYKEKIRTRCYGASDGRAPIFVELKKKVDGVVYKRRCSLPPKQARALIAGTRKPQTQIEREIAYACRRYEGLRPMAFLAYDREAWYGRDDHDLRMTFDTNVRVRWDRLSLSSGTDGRPVTPAGTSILEVKTTGGMPLWLTHLLDEEGIRKTSFSKYGTACRQRLEREAA